MWERFPPWTGIRLGNMAENVFRKIFAAFKGLDNRSNDLVRQTDYAISMKNCEIAYDGTIRLRRGEKICCTDGENNQAYAGLMRHVRLNPVTGITEEKLIGAGREGLLHELKMDGKFSISCSLAGSTFSFYSDGTNYHAVCKVGASTVLDHNCGDGGLVGTFVTLEQLMTAVNAIAGGGWTANITPRGVCNANGTFGKTYAAPLVMKAGAIAHTIRVGDTVKIGTAYRKVTRVSGNNLWWSVDADLTVVADQVIGIPHYGAVSLPITDSAPVYNVTLDLPIYFWGDVRHPTGYGPFVTTHLCDSDLGTFTEAGIGSSVYIFGPYGDLGYGGLWKYDGNECYRSGIESQFINKLAWLAGAGAGYLTVGGVYKYLTTMSFKDNNGLVIESDPPSSIHLEEQVTGAIASGSESVQYNFSMPGYGYNINFAIIGAAQTNLTTGVTVATGHTMKPGNRAMIFNVRSSANEVVERVLTAVDDTHLYWDTAAAIDVTNTPYPQNSISNGALWTLWRTKANGQTYYRVVDYPASPSVTGVGSYITDGMADTGLLDPYTFPEAGREHAPPPSMQYGCEHQGLLVGAVSAEYANGALGVYEANTARFSLPECPEYFPRAYNSFDIPSGVSTAISAIASNGPSVLMVFKDEARHGVLGDLDSYAFTIEKSAEFNGGCPAHDAIALVWQSLAFPSRQGILSSVQGQVASDLGLPVLKDFMSDNNFTFQASTLADPIPAANEAKLFLRGARTALDPINQQVWFYFPCVSLDVSETILRTNTGSKLYVLDLKTSAWYDWTFTDSALQPFCGMRINAGKLYWFGRCLRTVGGAGMYGGLVSRNNSNTDYDFISGALALDGDVKFQWEDLGDPSFYKDFLRLKLVRLNDILTAFTLRVQTYLDYNQTTVSTDTYKSFTTANPRELDIKLMHHKCRTIMLRLRNMAAGVNVPNKPMEISGLEWTVSVPHRKEDAAI